VVACDALACDEHAGPDRIQGRDVLQVQHDALPGLQVQVDDDVEEPVGADGIEIAGQAKGDPTIRPAVRSDPQQPLTVGHDHLLPSRLWRPLRPHSSGTVALTVED
jgi:hypothetical protein